MNKVTLFPNSKMGYDEYLKNIQDIMSTSPFVSCKSNIEVGIESMIQINEPEKRQKMIEISLLIDKESVSPSTMNNKLFKKLPVIMTIANLLANHYDMVEDLTIEQLVFLGHFSYSVNPEYMNGHLRFAANKNLLQATIDKSNDIYERNNILGVVEDKYFEFAIDKKDSIALNSFLEESVAMIRQTPKEEILGMVKPIEVVVAELEKEGFRF